VALELVGSEVAEELYAVAAFDEREPLSHEAFQFDGVYLPPSPPSVLVANAPRQPDYP
jgi:hypothetical protein